MPSRARSLAEDLRHRSDAALAELFEDRPDLRRPVPRSFSDLAARANSGPATVTAMNDLTVAELVILEAATALSINGKFTVSDLAAGLTQPADSSLVLDPVSSLLRRALLWGQSDDLRVPSAVREAVGPYPCGLDSIARTHLANRSAPERERAIAAAPAAARDQLVNCMWGPPTMPEMSPQTSAFERDARTWLATQGLIARDDLGNDVLPREIALSLRHGQLIRNPQLEPPPEYPPTDSAVAKVDRHNGHAADQLLRSFDRIATHLTRDDIKRQANSAVAARDWERLQSNTGLPALDLALLVDLAWATGAIDLDSQRLLRPTSNFEQTLDQDRSQRWAALAATWFASDRMVGLDPQQVLAASPDQIYPTLRALILEAASRVARPEVPAWLQWHRPRRTFKPAVINAVLAEADTIGLTQSSITKRAETMRLRRYIEALLPTLTDKFILQADLTATALGPLTRLVERKLTQIAEPESGGGAAVYRFSATSVGRGLAEGLQPAEMVVWLSATSATPVPQALSVLISDVAAGMPKISVHAVQSVLKCDPETADTLLADERLHDLGLHRLGPSALAAAVPSPELSRRLAEVGLVADNPDQRVRPLITEHRPRSATRYPTPTPERIVSSLRQVEAREHPEEHPPISVPTPGATEIQERLFTASVHHLRLWLDYSEADGQRETHLVEPLSIADGEVCGFDVTAGEIRVIDLARIVGLAPAQQ